MPTIELANDHLRVVVLPATGGGLLAFDAWQHGAWQPVMRRGVEADALLEPKELACYPLVPWSNRIGHGQFLMNGRAIKVPSTRADEPYPLHGDAWLLPWSVRSQSSHSVELLLVSRQAVPFQYEAHLRYEIDGWALKVTLSVLNLGDRLPFGVGLHPFFPRTDSVQLEASASGVWRAAPDHLPTQLGPLPPAFDFNAPKTLDAETVIDHSFEGWNGHAHIRWPEQGLGLAISAQSSRFVLYTPSASGFFCFEPVDHTINAHNLPGTAPSHGLTVLENAERLQRSYQFLVKADS